MIRKRALRGAVVAVVLATATTACSAGPGPLETAFGGEQPRAVACMPLGVAGGLTGQGEIVAFPAGTVPAELEITGVEASIPDGVVMRIAAILEPNDSGELAPQTAFFATSLSVHLPDFEIVDLPDQVTAGAHGLMIAAVFEADRELPTDRLLPVEVSAVEYRVSGHRFRLPVSRRFDLVLADPSTVSDDFPMCGRFEEDA